MFCPDFNGECKGPDCRDWDKDSQKCIVQVGRELTKHRDAQLDKMVSGHQEAVRLWKMSETWTKVQLNIILQNPMVPEEIKDAVRKAMEAPSSEIAEQLLRDAGLLD